MANGCSFALIIRKLKIKKKLALNYIFDLLYLNGQDLRTLPLIERKEKLRALLQNVSSFLIFSDHLEGIVSKLGDSPYRPSRNDLWVKTKCSLRQEFFIGGRKKT